MKWFRKSYANVSTVAGFAVNAQCTMHNAQLRKGRAGRRWTAAAAAWVLAAGTLLGSAGSAWAAGWCGNSYIFIKKNGSSDATWYNGSGSGNHALSEGFGTATTLVLGGQCQVWWNGSSGAKMWYNATASGHPTISGDITLTTTGSWSGNNEIMQGEATVSGLLPGVAYSFEMGFYCAGADDKTYNASFTMSSSAPHSVSWRGEATSGSWVVSSGEPPWWYSYGSGGAGYKPNIGGANNVRIANNNQTSQTLGNNNITVASLSYEDDTGSSIQLSNHTLASGSTSYKLTVNSSIANTSSGSHTISAPIVLGNNVTVNAASGLTFSGVVSGSYNLTKSGSGTLTLSGANTYTGTTTINAGTVVATVAAALGTTAGGTTIANGATLKLSPSAAISRAEPLTINGGTLYNTSYANTLSGTVALGANSTVNVAADQLLLSGVISGAYKLTKSGSGTLILSAANTYSGGTAVSAGTLTASNNAAAMGTGTVTLSSGTTLNLHPSTAKTYANTLVVNGATIKNTVKDNVLSGGVTLGGNSTVNVAAAADTLTMSGIINSGTSSYGLTKSGSGTLKLTGVNTYKGATAVSAGTLQFTDASGLGTTAGATTVASDATLNYAPASTGTTVSEPVTLNGGTLSLTANNATWGGAVTLGANSTVSAASSKNLTVTGIISGSGKALTKEGDGTVTLGAANTYSGATTVNAGTLAIANGGSIAGNLSVASGATASVTKNSGVTWTYGGVVSGSGSFTKAGAGTLIVTGANTFDGTTTVSAGTLQIGNGGTTGSWADDMGGSGTVAFNRSDAITYAGVLSGTLKLAKEGTGTLTLSGTSTMSGATTVSAGTLLLSGSLASSAVTVESGGTLSASGTPSVGSLTVKSGGALTVSRANTLSSGGAADLKNGAVVNFDATGWSKAGSTMSWTVFAGGAAASVGTVTLNVTAATGTSASEYTIAASGNNVVVTWTKATTAPVIGSPTAASIAPTSATLGGTVTSDGNDTITEYGVVWSTSANPTTGSHAGGGISTASGAPTIDSAFTRSATGLTAGTTYHYRAYAKNGVDTSYTDDATFTAPTVVGLSTTTFTYPGAGNTLTLAGTGGSGSGGYSYSVQSGGSGSGSIDGSALTVTACGTIVIRVTKAADSPYASQYADVVVTVNKAVQTLTFSPASPVFGADVTSYTVTASGNGSPTITYSSSSTAVASINSSSGVMTRGSTGYGTVTITAIAAETANYLGKTNTVSVKVMGKRPTSNPATLSFTATATGSMTINFKQASDSTGIVLVMKAGGAPTTAPTDGSLPKTSAISDNATTFGESPAAGSAANGYVVYAGTGGTGTSGYTLTVNGLTAGTQYYVTAYPYKGGSGTYAYKNSSLTTINGYTLADPVTTASATADGKTMVRLSWSKPAGASGTMVVWEGTTEPTQGTSYAVGATTLGGKVLYRSTGSSPTLEHVVPAGATYTYKFYAYSSADAYSEALARTASLGSFGSGEIVDTFSYTNGASLSGLNGANGWTNSWVISGTGPTIVSQTGSSIPVFTNYTEYPGNTGNRMKVAMNSDAANFAATRGFPAVSSGTIYAAAIMSYHYAGNTKWCRIALQDGDTAKMAAGRIWESGDDKTIGIDDCNGSRTHGTYNLNPWETSTNNDYLVIMKYDFSAKTISARAYYHGEAVPSEAPTTWHVTKTLTANFPSKLNKVSLQAGSDAGGYTGDVYFDEVRVATSWSKLLQQEAVAPNPPTSVTATADGNEMVRVGWTKNASGNGVMVLATTDGTTPAAPAAGTAYSQGATVSGTTKVAYKGTGTDADLVVAPGTTVKVAVYSYNGDNLYSTAETPAAVTTGTYESWEKLDTMSYTNGVQVSDSGNAWKGGQGWGDNYWGSSGSGNWYSLKPAEVPSYMVNHVTNYPDSVGNVICITNLSDGQSATFNRVVESFGGSSGTTIYFAYRMAYAWSESGKNRWAGIEFVSDVSGEKYVFVGKAAATDHQYHLGITATGASSPCWPDVGGGGAAYELKGLGDYSKSAYLVVGKIQWVSDTLVNVYANAFYTGDGNALLPENEPSWGSYGYSGATLGAINSIRFKAGADSGHGTIGFAYFDELRWGTSWEQLLAGKAPTDVWMDGQTTHVYTGDIVTNAITSEPKGAKQSAQSLIWTTQTPADATWTTHAIAAGFYTNKASDTQTEWHGVHQITNVPSSTTLTLYGLGAVTGNGVTRKSPSHGTATYRKHTYTVRALKKPSLSVTPGDFKENLSWTRAQGYNEAGTSSTGRTFNEVMVVRYSGNAATNLDTLLPVDGTTYYEGSIIYYNGDPTESRYMTVVYRGNATSCVDAGLAKSNTYHYAAFTVNNSHYSPRSDIQSGETTGTSTTPTVDGTTTDWVGGASTTPNSAAYSEEEFIWTDKSLDGRENTDACFSADIREFRVKATASTVYFLVRLAHSTPTQVVPTNAYITVGVDTRTNSASTAMNWLGDEAATFVGGGYWQTNGAIHFPERQMAVHYVGGSENTWQVEMYAENGAEWYAPKTSWSAACSANASGDPCIEWSVAREDLGLSGACTGRFTVASFVNSGAWNNQGSGTVRFDSSSCAAVDAMEFVPYGVNDQDGKLGAWDEGLKGGNVNFWADVRFARDGLAAHATPSAPTAGDDVPGTTGSSGGGSPKLTWTGSTVDNGFVTGYLLEVATNAAFGAAGDTLLYRVNIEGAGTTNYQTRTSVSNFYWRVRARSNSGILSSGPARSYTVTGKKDVDGPVAKLLYVGTNVMAFINNTIDPETGIGYRDDQEASGDATSVEDSDLQDGGHVFGFVIEWYDVNGVYATNHNRTTGGFAWNILAEHADGNPYGRVSPNWDLLIIDRKTPAGTPPAAETVDGTNTIEYVWKEGLVLPTENGGTETIDCWYIDCGKDAVFTNDYGVTQVINDGNFGQYVTNYVTNAFQFGGYRDGVELYLTVSAEDGNTQGASGPGNWFSGPLPNKSGSDPEGSWGPDPRAAGVNCSGYCADGPNSERNVTTNQLLKFYVRDNDAMPPVASTNVWGARARDASGALFTPSLVISTGAVTKAQTTNWDAIPGKLAPISGAGRDVTYQLTDQVIGETNLTFLFNVYDDYLHSGLKVGTTRTTRVDSRDLTNTAFKVLTWDGKTDNWLAGAENTAEYKSSLSTLVANGTGAGTVLAWAFAGSGNPVTEEHLEALFGMEHILSYIGTNSAGATNLVQLHAWDVDDNRDGDQADAELSFGKLMLTDDDATAPTTPGVDFIGSGTNYVRYGEMAKWDWGDSTYSGWPCTSVTNGMSGGAVSGGIVKYTSGTRDDGAATLKWGGSPKTAYMENDMDGTGSSWSAKKSAKSAGMKYFQWDAAGVNETRWIADTLVFKNRQTATGPTNFALTVMSPTAVASYPALDAELGALSNTWTMTYGSYGKVAGLYRATFVDTNSSTATLQSVAVDVPSSVTYARVLFRLGGFGISPETHSTYTGVTMTWTIRADGAATELGGSIALSSFTNSAAAENYKNWNEYSIELPVPAAGTTRYQVEWTAAGINGSQGFVMRDMSLVTQSGWGDEDVLVDVQTVSLDVNDAGSAVATAGDVTMMWNGREVGDDQTVRFRLYGWGASSSDGNWGVDDLRLEGISFSPKGHEVTDHDLRNGWWTNALEVLDGTPTGYDMEQSGLWIEDDGAGYAQKLPSYEMRWPAASTGAGGVMSTGLYSTAGMTEAAYTTVPDGAFTNASSSWAATGGANARYEWGKAKVGATVLRLPGGSGPSATQTNTLNTAGLEHPVTGATVGGVLYIRALSTTDEGVDNRLWLTLEMLNSSDATLASKTYELTAALMARWQEVDLGSWAVDNPNIRKLKVTIAQTEATATEVYVDDVEIQVALWGGEEDNPENGTRGGRFRFSTLALPKETVPALPLSDELGGGDSAEYTLSSLVYDYDHDRTDDALPLAAVNRFSLYDNDTMAPLTGNRFGGAMGIRLGNGSGQPHTGSGTAVLAYVSDHELETTEAAAKALNASSHGKLYLDIDGYDLSGWTTDDIRTDYTNAAGNTYNDVQLYAVDQSKWFKSAGGNTNGAAGLPSATNTLVSGTDQWWTHPATNEFTTPDFSNALPATVRAQLRDLDNDRTGDQMSVNTRIGLLKFIDNDANAPQYKTTGMQLKQVFIGTNAAAIATVTQNVAKSTWSAKNQYELRLASGSSSDPAADRTHRVYDSELTDPRSGFYVIAGLGETKVTTYGRSTMGVQRGTTLTQGRTNAFGNVFTVTNTHLKLASEGAAAALVYTNWSSAWSCPQADTIGVGTVAGHNTWYWGSNMTAAELAALLPSGETKRSWTMTVEAWDADTDRPDDQLYAQLAGPTLQVWDDDMTNPYDLEDMKVNGSTVSGSITRENAAWTNNLENWELNFRALGDRDPTEGEDLRKSGVNLADGYRMVMKTETVTTTAGNAWLGLDDVVTLTAEDDPDTSGRVNATPSAEMLSRVTQGLTTQMVFAVDADADRTGDALASGGVDVPLAYDVTRPTKIGYDSTHRLTADPENTDDPTTQFDLTWPTTYNGTNPVGPDDPTDTAHHPTKEAADTDLFSPWATYKIYYGTYDETDVPETGTDLYFYNKFIATNAYKTFDFVTAESGVSDPSATNALPYGSLTNVTADAGTNLQKIRLYDLDFDQHYIVVIVGVDKAGNEGLADAYSWATNNTIKFAVTQGVIKASADINAMLPDAGSTNLAYLGMNRIDPAVNPRAAVLYWKAAGMKEVVTTNGAVVTTNLVGKVSKQYDLIYRDASSFNELGNETWHMAGSDASTNSGTSRTNWNYQTDAGLETPNRLRFFRASYHDRWQDTKPGTGEKQYPLASEEVYSMNNVVLSEGFNYVSLQGVPWTNTFEGVFGTDTDMWPGGVSGSDSAVQVAFFAPGTTETTNEWFFFGSDGRWYDSQTNNVTTNLQPAGFFARPFSLTMPDADAAWWDEHGDYEGATYGSKKVKAMLWHPIMQVPTNSPRAAAQTVVKTAKTYNLLSLNLPVSVHPGALGLVESGMCASDDPRAADKLYTIDPATKQVRYGSMMYCDSKGTWHWVKGQGEVSGAVIRPNDMLVILSSGNAAGDWTWTYTPSNFYKLPNRHMGRSAASGQ
jgi:autotransporter-associated beta strand protein